MKYTSLFSAVALAAAMGTQAFGAPTEVNSDNFEGYEVGSVTNAANTTQWNAKHWSFEGDENDCQIVAGTVTETGSDSKSLKLNTNGGLATFAAQTTKDYAATVTMKVRMVASDSPVDMSTDTTTQAALYLQSTEENGVTTYELKAFSYDTTADNGNGDNVWLPLTATGFEIDHDNYDANVSIVIDYIAETATYTVNGTEFAPIKLANPDAYANTKCLNSVAFKGTGFVDDLFVGEEQIGTFATFAYETILNGVTTVEDSGTSKNLDNASWSYVNIAEEVTGYEYTLKLYSRENDVDTDLNATITADASGQWTVNASTYASFAGGGTYVVKAEYTKLQLAVTVNYYAGADTTSEKLDTVNATVPYGDTYAVDISEYPNVTDSDIECNGETYDDAVPITAAITINVFNCSTGSEPTTWTAETTIGTLTFTAYDPALGTASFTWTAAAGYNFVEGDTAATLGVLTATTADGVPAVDATATVTLHETTSPLTGDVSGLPTTGNSLFLFGVGDKAAQQAGE